MDHGLLHARLGNWTDARLPAALQMDQRRRENDGAGLLRQRAQRRGVRCLLRAATPPGVLRLRRNRVACESCAPAGRSVLATARLRSLTLLAAVVCFLANCGAMADCISKVSRKR